MVSPSPRIRWRSLKLPLERDFIQEFMQETSALQTPDNFRLWGAISTVSAALQRNVWIDTVISPVYPNTFVMLLAPPGVGKNVILSRVRDYISQIETVHLGRSDMTRASLVDELELGLVPPDNLKGIPEYNSLTIVMSEFGTMFSEYDHQFISVLSNLWDCESYTESKRTNKTDIYLERVQVTMIVGTQPGFIRAIIPPIAWEQGMMSRIILVYAGEAEPVPLFTGNKRDTTRHEWLRTNIQKVGKLRGPFDFTKEAIGFLEAFNMKAKKEGPDHLLLYHYRSRRMFHYLKLIQIAAAAKGKMLIDINDCERAMGWLVETEANMSEGLGDMAATGRNKEDLLKDTWDYLVQEYDGENPVPKDKIYRFLNQRVQPFQIKQVIDALEQAGLLRILKGGFKPRAPE